MAANTNFIRTLRRAGLISLAGLGLGYGLMWAATAAHADGVNPGIQASTYNTPFGYQYGEQERIFQPGTRDGQNNRIAIDGRILLGEEASNLPRTLRGDIGPSFSSQFGNQAVGNQLNVITTGDWNTVVVDSNQINNGDVTAVTSLNGELELNDQ